MRQFVSDVVVLKRAFLRRIMSQMGGVMVFVDLKKYGLDQTEIDFIETKVKAMD